MEFRTGHDETGVFLGDTCGDSAFEKVDVGTEMEAITGEEIGAYGDSNCNGGGEDGV